MNSWTNILIVLLVRQRTKAEELWSFFQNLRGVIMAKKNAVVSSVVSQVAETAAVKVPKAPKVVVPKTPKVVVPKASELSSLIPALVEAKAPEVVVAKTDRNEGVGQFIKRLIGEGLGNKEILAIVHEQFGNKNTSYACVAWYRNAMKKSGTDVKKSQNLEWLQNFAKANGLSEEAVQELSRRVA